MYYKPYKSFWNRSYIKFIRTKMNFQSEKLIVDWISFNIEGLRDPNSIVKISIYLSELISFFSQKYF